MPEQEVVTTEETTEAVEQVDSSSAETTETQTEETQAEETGEQETTEEQVAEPVEGETEAKPKDEKAKAESREAYLKRQLEKSQRELAEAKAKAESSPARQQELQRQAQEAKEAEIQEYMDTLGVSQPQAEFLVRKQEEKTRQAVASQVQPLTGTMYETQFENIKRELASDPEIIDMKSLDKEVKVIAQQYKVSGNAFYLGNKEVVKNIYLHVQAKKTRELIKAAEERGRKLALQDKRIEGEVGMPRTAVNGKATPGITQADKDYAELHDVTPEKAREWRLLKEKKQKTK